MASVAHRMIFKLTPVTPFSCMHDVPTIEAHQRAQGDFHMDLFFPLFSLTQYQRYICSFYQLSNNNDLAYSDALKNTTDA